MRWTGGGLEVGKDRLPSPLWDRLSLGPRRRRRVLDRRLRQLEREAVQARSPRRRERGRGLLVLAMTACVAVFITVLSPGLAPAPVRDLLSRTGLIGGGGPLVEQAPDDGRSSFAFLRSVPGTDQPVRWYPCRAIPVVVNPDGGPSDAVELVRESMAEVSDLTGLSFDYRGTSDDRPEWDAAYRPSITGRDRPVLVSWAEPDEVPQLRGDVAGLGGAVAVQRGRSLQYVSGGVTFDRGSFRELDSSVRGRAYQQAIVLHELGHLVGLGHVEDTGELMNARNDGRTDFGPGDRIGLARLGAGRC